MLPEVIPLFPLPNVVLFPHMPLPLHIFESRYRAMVRDATRGARLIGMVLLRGDWQSEYLGKPPIFPVGTVGEMARVEELADGRFNVVLRGLREFHVDRELEGETPYRQAAVTMRPPAGGPLAAGVRDDIVRLVQRYLERAGRGGQSAVLAPDVDDEVFVNFFAQHLELDVLEKQALLEASTLGQRAARLRDVLEFMLEELRVHPVASPHRTH
jgi:Lon protease-like protein